MQRLSAIRRRCVHGGIRHLEIDALTIVLRTSVHGGIRHLEI
ncbi:hypothetical protein J518_1309 [Acinetobacter baumannii 1419130]|nr:hypothetical protein J518_1309 [Acinetobacter baumannii 1419130]